MEDLEKKADKIIIENEPFVITDEWLIKHRTKNRAWTMKQLKVLGIQCPKFYHQDRTGPRITNPPPESKNNCRKKG